MKPNKALPPGKTRKPIKIGDKFRSGEDEIVEVESIPPMQPGTKPVVWVKIIESNSPKRVGKRIQILLSVIIEQQQSKKGKQWQEAKAANHVKAKEDYSQLSPKEYALKMAGAEEITDDLLELMDTYLMLSDNKIMSMLRERGLSTAGTVEEFLPGAGGRLLLVKKVPKVVKLQFAAQLAVYDSSGEEQGEAEEEEEEEEYTIEPIIE